MSNEISGCYKFAECFILLFNLEVIENIFPDLSYISI
jgi:hypothetical protein